MPRVVALRYVKHPQKKNRAAKQLRGHGAAFQQTVPLFFRKGQPLSCAHGKLKHLAAGVSGAQPFGKNEFFQRPTFRLLSQQHLHARRVRVEHPPGIVGHHKNIARRLHRPPHHRCRPESPCQPPFQLGVTQPQPLHLTAQRLHLGFVEHFNVSGQNVFHEGSIRLLHTPYPPFLAHIRPRAVRRCVQPSTVLPPCLSYRSGSYSVIHTSPAPDKTGKQNPATLRRGAGNTEQGKSSHKGAYPRYIRRAPLPARRFPRERARWRKLRPVPRRRKFCSHPE